MLDKLKIIIIALSVALLSYSCNKIPELTDTPKEIVFSATFGQTKTVLSGRSVLWEKGDRISIFDGTVNKGVSTEDSGSSATFKVAMSTEGPWYAMYPHDAGVTIDGDILRVSVPSQQTAIDGSFAPRQNLTIARSSGTSLEFKNALAYVKLSVSRDNVTSITFTGNASEYLSGTIDLDYNSGTPVYSVVSGETSVSLSPLSGCFKQGTQYYVAILPQTLSSGFSMQFTLSDGTGYSASVSKELVLKRSTIIGIGDPEAGVEFTEVIVFDDPDVERNVVAHLRSKGYSINADGKLSKSVAASVSYSDLSSLTWTNAADIDSFDELKYFTGLKNGTIYSLPRLFTGCTSLTSVVIPSNIQQIEASAFSGCTSLASVTLPTSLETIGNNAFYSCNSLTRCSADGRDYLKLPSKVRTVGQYAFSGCNALPVNSDSFTGSSLETIGDRAFRLKLAQNVVLPSSLQSISARAFEGTKLINLTLLGTTPPSIPAANSTIINIFQGGTTPNIFVPSGALSSYQGHAEWSQYYENLSSDSGFIVPSGVEVKGYLIDVRDVKSGQDAFPQNSDYQFGDDIVGLVGAVRCADSHLERRGVTSMRCTSGSPMIACVSSSVAGWSYTGKTFTLASRTWYIHVLPAYSQGTWIDVPFSDSWGFCPLVIGDNIEVADTEEFGTVISYIGKLRGGAVNNACITLLPDGTYLAACTNVKEQSGLTMFRSTDKGATWSKYGNFTSDVNLIVNFTNFFVLDDTVYLMGLAKDGDGNSVGLRISKSTDNGLNWTVPESSTTGLLLEGRYNTGQVPCVVAGGRVWRACENEKNKPFMLSAPVDSDLLKASNWTTTNTVSTTSFDIGGDRITSIGEGNAVVGPDGKVVDVVRCDCNTSSGYAAILHTTGTTTLSYNTSTDWVNLPGGGKKFTIRYDEKSGLYWSLTNPHFEETVTNIGMYSEGMSPGLKRNRLVLVSSPDLREWTVKRTILYDEDPFFHGFQYADWVIDGDDMAVVVRAAYPERRGLPKRQHDANKFIFVNVPNFRAPGIPAGNESFNGHIFNF